MIIIYILVIIVLFYYWRIKNIAVDSPFVGVWMQPVNASGYSNRVTITQNFVVTMDDANKKWTGSYSNPYTLNSNVLSGILDPTQPTTKITITIVNGELHWTNSLFPSAPSVFSKG